MSISRKIYDSVLRVKSFTERKTFQYSLTAFLATLLFFGTFNVYAQDEEGISPDWGGTKVFHNEISGTDADEDNMNSRQGLELLNVGWTGVSLLAPEITANSEDVLTNANIPYDLKRGLIGLADDAGDTVLAAYPLVNIPEHLALQWVPGYKDSTSSLYAAHDSGYETLMSSGISTLWAKSLNYAYVFFVVVMIIAGFMIMFRHKLGGQTMVTLGSILPRVIVSLIIATFSFAIAGLLIDVGGLINVLIIDIFGLGGKTFAISGLPSIMASVFFGGLETKEIVTGVLGSLGLGALGFGGTALGIAALAGAITLNPFLLAGVALVGVIGLGLTLGVLAIVLTGAIKVLITLYKAYFGLLISVIIGPIQITLGAIPGNSHMVKNWFLSVLRNVLVFPLVLAIINIPNALATDPNNKMGLSFPGKLVYQDPNTYDPMLDKDITGTLFIMIMKIFVLFFAAQAPKFLETWIPPADNKALGEGFGAARGSLSKIPLLGGMFK